MKEAQRLKAENARKKQAEEARQQEAQERRRETEFSLVSYYSAISVEPRLVLGYCAAALRAPGAV